METCKSSATPDTTTQALAAPQPLCCMSSDAIDALIPIGLTIVAGAPQCGADTLAAEMAIAVQTGCDIWGHQPNHGNVLAVCGSLVSVHAMQDALQSRGADIDACHDMRFGLCLSQLDADLVAYIAEYCNDHTDIQMLTLDLSSDIVTSTQDGWTINQDMADCMSALRQIAHDHHISIVLVADVMRRLTLGWMDLGIRLLQHSDAVLIANRIASAPDCIALTAMRLGAPALQHRLVHDCPGWSVVHTSSVDLAETADDRLRVIAQVAGDSWTGTIDDLVIATGIYPASGHVLPWLHAHALDLAHQYHIRMIIHRRHNGRHITLRRITATD